MRGLPMSPPLPTVSSPFPRPTRSLRAPPVPRSSMAVQGEARPKHERRRRGQAHCPRAIFSCHRSCHNPYVTFSEPDACQNEFALGCWHCPDRFEAGMRPSACTLGGRRATTPQRNCVSHTLKVMDPPHEDQSFPHHRDLLRTMGSGVCSLPGTSRQETTPIWGHALRSESWHGNKAFIRRPARQ